ncbi:hypothetical protein SELMODRAFT_266713 [Selaginella moellendorffii]|uniref:Uncharacterized protein n=1 Tax=Selaginella moellendorffii TaxID=88036 RepID=D8QX09_SELML|nr:hypothetical protein SELMODRAFT_266713 [Selaginella moellendorffii]
MLRSWSLGVRDPFSPTTLLGCAAEFIGTFLFVFLGCGSVVSSGIVDDQLNSARLLVIAIAHGFAIAILVAATAGVSGGHLNPAVSFGFMMSGNMSIIKGLMYWISQLAGAVLGAGFYREFPSAIAGHFGAHAVNSKFTVIEAFGLEALLTFVLVYVIFGTAVDKKGPSTIAPLTIGMAVLVDHLVGVPVTGASMNPARSLGAALWSGQWKNHWIYWAAPLLGATAAALIYTALFLPTVSSTQKQSTNDLIKNIKNEKHTEAVV